MPDIPIASLEDEIRAIGEGMQAFIDGEAFDDCPYSRLHPLCVDWKFGYVRAERRLTGVRREIHD